MSPFWERTKSQNQPQRRSSAEGQASTTGCIPTDRGAETQLRVQLNVWLEQVAIKHNWKGKRILEVGIAGDDRPSGSYKFFGRDNEWKTLDINEKWQPNIVADITDSGVASKSFDVVIMTQTLEHIWDFRKALSEIARIAKEYAIIDCPFMFMFHQDKARVAAHWSDWDDYWRFTPAAFKRLLKEAGFKKVDVMFNRVNTLAVCQK
jgi:SAM-dependent methyltransferase